MDEVSFKCVVLAVYTFGSTLRSQHAAVKLKCPRFIVLSTDFSPADH